MMAGIAPLPGASWPFTAPSSDEVRLVNKLAMRLVISGGSGSGSSYSGSGSGMNFSMLSS